MNVLADSSAWIELLRDTDTATDREMRQRLRVGEIATTDMVITEVLAGATNATRLAGIETALHACRYLPQRRLVDAFAAADLYRQCRRRGETPRQVSDCLIAAVAMRHRLPVLHHDRDFEVLARYTALETVTA